MKWSESDNAHKSDCRIAHLEKTLSDGSAVTVERELAPEVCDNSRRFNDTVRSRMVVDANREELSLQRRLAQEKARTAGNIEPAIRTKSVPPEVLAGPEPQDLGPDLAAQGINDAELDDRVRDAVREALGMKPEAPTAELETHFADLMLADETLDDAKARLSQRLRELRHYLIAPEIKVNEDGSVGLTAGEQSELQDLERRQTLGRWLEA
jgi:hypothetical protein